jgi:steroid 5-alpha reductase family enzyme
MELTQQILLALGLSVLVMVLTWLVCIWIGNAGWVDVVWAYTIGALSLLHYLTTPADSRSWLGLVFILVWSIRLGTHLAIRIASEPEDGRYQAIKAKWGGPQSPKFFGFFMIQAAAAWVFSLPPLLAIRAGIPNEWLAVALGIMIAAIALLGEAVADAQLKAFKNNPANKGQVCKAGLWRYSRHPNYFFEWLFWWSFAALSWGSALLAPALVFPVIMLFLILKMTGIPPTEAQAIRKRGELYRQYQRETSAFFPWFPKKPTGVRP